MRLQRILALSLVVASSGILTARAQKDAPTVDDVLKAAGDYLVEYSQKLQAVAADEEYLQMDTGGNRVNHTRRVNSDVVMVGLDRGQSTLYRDAFAIDTRPLHERNDRLLKLFSDPPGPPIGPLQYAQRFTDESVSAYVSPALHVLDSPFVVFELLRASNQARTEFKLDGVKSSGGTRVATLKFKERGTESLITVPPIPVTGKFTIEWPSGAIRQTDVVISSTLLNLRASTTFALDKATGLWLPKEIAQFYDISEPGAGGTGTLNNRQSFETHIRYSKYHQILIDLSKMR